MSGLARTDSNGKLFLQQTSKISSLPPLNLDIDPTEEIVEESDQTEDADEYDEESYDD
jgi:hypothetical protein